MKADRFPPYQGPDWDRKIHKLDNPHFWKFSVANLVFLDYVKGKSPMLDLGCGTGGAAIFLAEKLGTEWVIGADLIKDMIRVARKNAAKGGFGENVCFLVCDGRNLPFKASCFEAIVSRGDAFCFLVPLKNAVKELRRVMKPKAVVVLEMDNRADWKPGTSLSTTFRKTTDGRIAYVVETFTTKRNHVTISYILDPKGEIAEKIAADPEFREKRSRAWTYSLEKVKKETIEMRRGTLTQWPTAKELHALFCQSGFSGVEVLGNGLLMKLLLDGDKAIVEAMKKHPSAFLEIERRLVPYVDPGKAPTIILRATVSRHD